MAKRVRKRKIVFARINRRTPGQETLSSQRFAEDMQRLAESRRTRYQDLNSAGELTRTWIAADMRTDPSGTFLAGTLGYSIREDRKAFDEESWPWIKGETDPEDRASQRTVAPFAVDLREGYRWVAFSPIGHLTSASLRSGLQKVILQA
ncbi:MAG: hypothetical protein LC775_13400, partial [Acidobacteria bacterium]|nr:hypothetical protein [Acidobacteriota bacterium]